MPIFFEVRSIEPIRDAVREALAQDPPDGAQLESRARAVTNSLAEHRGGSIQPRLWSFVVAAALLGILAALAMWAEATSMEKSTDQLWTAFQTILGVIVGFLGGEAAGVATAPRKG